jgi:hypothetical protein
VPSRTWGGRIAGALALAVFAAAGSVPSAAIATTHDSLPPTGAGFDISYPQCAGTSHVDLPGDAPFAIVGVNGGIATRSNPCFLSQYNSALLLSGTSEQPHVALYVNTGNPSLAATWWPDSDYTQSGTLIANPYGTCAHDASAACAYIYGYSAAQADYGQVDSEVTRVPNLWWLDVETTNTWQYADTQANAASLTGMVRYFHSKGLEVGLYSTSYQWNRIAGQTSASSPLAGLRSWLAGATEVGAADRCSRAPLTPDGRVTMVQYVGHFDNDLSCHQFSTAKATVSPSTAFGDGAVLSATTGHWVPDTASYSYQWNRDGVAIIGATGPTYATTTADVGTSLSVTITGTLSGYTTASVTSARAMVLDPDLAPE